MIYADYNATTPLSEAAKAGMAKAFECWGNPSSSHRAGRQANALLEESRDKVASAAGLHAREIVFTSGGSEANGMVLMGSALQCGSSFRLLTSPVEHASVEKALPLLCEKLGAQVERVALAEDGALDMADFRNKLETFRPHLVSLMAANNETGVLFPVNAIAEICAHTETLFHTDATQAFGKIPSTDFNRADFITLSAHKIYGPKGVGALVIRGDRKLECTRFGGSQEIKRRGGTQNMIGIAGFAAACEDLKNSHVETIRALRDRFEAGIKNSLSDFTIHGATVSRLPNTTCIRFHGILSEILLTALDLDGFCASGGSACSSGSASPSHVLTALGLAPEKAKEAMRISWGRFTTDEEIDRSIELFVRHVSRIRQRRMDRKAL
ncbi:MAG: cysteine desulfurase [Bdellovibrionales bacterium]|nr:cysteine desulfurase [Bdellovibrionales bacterium]